MFRIISIVKIASLFIACSPVAFVSAAQTDVLNNPMRPSYLSPPEPVLKDEEKAKPVAIAKPKKKLKLSAITYSDNALARSAIINDLWVKHGSVVDGATVLNIGDGIVELRRDGKKVVVRLVPRVKTNTES